MPESIDRAGRVVLPQEVRQRLDPVRRQARRVTEVDGLLVIERGDECAITDLDVQRWRDADER